MHGLIGAVMGLLVGLSLEDETKEHIANDIKNRLYYKNYNTNKAKTEEKEEESWKKALKFDTYREAEAFLSKLKDVVSSYGMLSIFDICCLRCLYYGDEVDKDYGANWSMNRYGWTKKMITTEATVSYALCTILLPKPVSLK